MARQRVVSGDDPLAMPAPTSAAAGFLSRASSFLRPDVSPRNGAVKCPDLMSAAGAPATTPPLPAPPPPPSTSPPGPPAAPSALGIDPEANTDWLDAMMLGGERRLMHLPKCDLLTYGGGVLTGQLLMTMYQLQFIPDHPPHQQDSLRSGHLPASYYRVPLALIERIERERDVRDATTGKVGVRMRIVCKDVRVLRIGTEKADQLERAINVLSAYAFPEKVAYLYAFAHRPGAPQLGRAVHTRIADLDLEVARQGALRTQLWRRTEANDAYAVCESYPQALVVPSSVTDADLFEIGQFRSIGRIPACTWASATHAGSIWRSSQPKVGMAGLTCLQDERMLDTIARAAADTPSSQGVLYIVDCRPKTNANANKLAGAGYESSTNYPLSKLSFWNIANIHAMRDSLSRLSTLSQHTGAADAHWGQAVEDSKWLDHVRLVLACGWSIAHMVHVRRAPVLIHCSHGWDRTSQTAAIAQLLLDPFYRTVEGLLVLIQKDFMAFGHPFAKRLCHGRVTPEAKNDIAPIFLQFLDCAWQLVAQFQEHFEFSADILLCIAHHIHSSRFGDFLFSCEKDREEAGAKAKTASLWAYLLANRASFESPLYRKPTADQAVLLPPLSVLMRRVRLWDDYFVRFSPKPTHTAPLDSAKTDEAAHFAKVTSLGSDLAPPVSAGITVQLQRLAAAAVPGTGEADALRASNREQEAEIAALREKLAVLEGAAAEGAAEKVAAVAVPAVAAPAVAAPAVAAPAVAAPAVAVPAVAAPSVAAPAVVAPVVAAPAVAVPAVAAPAVAAPAPAEEAAVAAVAAPALAEEAVVAAPAEPAPVIAQETAAATSDSKEVSPTAAADTDTDTDTGTDGGPPVAATAVPDAALEGEVIEV